MLGKLMKYEWKSITKIGCLWLAVMAGITILAVIYIFSPLFQGIIMGMDDLEPWMAMLTLGLFLAAVFLYVMTVVGAGYAMMLYLGIRFYKTMYSDQGYLTHTLPVTPSQLLNSKLFVGTVWLLLLGIGAFVSAIISAFAMAFSILQATGKTEEAVEFFRELPVELPEAMASILGPGVGWFYLVIFLSIVLGPLFNLCILYGSVTIGQLAKKHKILLGIFTYCGILMILNTFRTTFAYSFNLGFTIEMVHAVDDMGGILSLSTLIQLLVNCALAAGLYLLAGRIVKKHLNLE